MPKLGLGDRLRSGLFGKSTDTGSAEAAADTSKVSHHLTADSSLLTGQRFGAEANMLIAVHQTGMSPAEAGSELVA